MEDNNLEAIKAKRMDELRQNQGHQTTTDDNNAHEQRQEAVAREEMMKNSILTQILDQSARARLSNIAIAKPEKAKMLENTIIQMARYGQIAGKMDDAQLKSLLDKISEKTQKTTVVKFDRRRAALDSDSD